MHLCATSANCCNTQFMTYCLEGEMRGSGSSKYGLRQDIMVLYLKFRIKLYFYITTSDAILASISSISSDKAAVEADRIFEINPNSVHSVASIRESSSSVPNHRSSIELLCDELNALRKEVTDFRKSHSQLRNKQNGHVRFKSLEENLCWYRFEFQGAKMRFALLLPGKPTIGEVVKTYSSPGITSRRIFYNRQKYRGPPELASDRLKVAKDEIQRMIELNHLRPSKIAHASPMNMVPEKAHKIKKKNPHSKARNSAEQLEWNDDANLSFEVSKDVIANATLLRHPISGSESSMWVVASNADVSNSLMQQ
ncbi:hypothetical protein NPIL_215721 [Nephila pilipes]|uniref:Uncharacterized protein n=1 Tax=Nephila pilipes TaxID=299642 RepID=A0A8X6THZ7_NEPPI|nr:hypothetical protein NPIL_215721 [Nephila pilipes]